MFVFATYFAQEIAPDPVTGQSLWSLAGTLTGIAVAVLAPLMGSIADSLGRRKSILLAACAVDVFACLSLWFAIPGGGIPVSIIIVLIVSIGLAKEMMSVMHNSMLGSLTNSRNAGMLSGIGLAMGNAGNFISMIIYLIAVAVPAMGVFQIAFVPSEPLFGLDVSRHEHVRIVGPFAALWLIIFAIPFFLGCPDRLTRQLTFQSAVTHGYKQLVSTLRNARKYKNVMRFLIARMFYNDGIIAVQSYLAIYAVATFSWDLAEVLMFGLLMGVVCLFAGIVAGHIDRLCGSRKATILSLCTAIPFLFLTATAERHRILLMDVDSTIAPSLALPFYNNIPEMFFLGSALTLAAAATVTIVCARAMLTRIAPVDQIGQFFGLYAFSGTATAFLGHGLVALATVTFSSVRAGVLAPALLLLVGLLIFLKVREEQTHDPDNISSESA